MIRVAVLTVSDSRKVGIQKDLSGPALQARIAALGWSNVKIGIVADEKDQIATWIRECADSGEVDLILSTGGTGVAIRDVTPEAVRTVIDREVPGIGELMRSEGAKITPLSYLSRGMGGTRGRVLIAAVPGSPKGAVESLDAFAHLIPHMVGLLQGRDVHADEKEKRAETE
ncbi:MAG: MogA/MoaB family molybdenum cofactor biosynthesis protein [Bryobacteraceae bacterium]